MAASFVPLQLSPSPCFTFDGLYSGIGIAPCSVSIMVN